MQGRVQQPDGDRQALHGPEDALKVGPLEGQQVSQGLKAGLLALRHNHPPHSRNALLTGKEHVLSAAQADALRTKLPRLSCVLRRVCVGQHPQPAPLIHPLHKGPQVARQLGGGQGLLAADDLSRAAIEGYEVALADLRAVDARHLVVLVHLQVLHAGDAGLAPASCNHRCMASHAAQLAQHPLTAVHALHVLGGCLLAHQHHLDARPLPRLGLLRREDCLAHRGTRGGGQASAQHVGLVRRLVSKLGVQQLVQVAGLDHGDGPVDVHQALLHQVNCNLDGSGPGALAPPALQHEQLALLHRELYVLHVLVVALQDVAVLNELGVRVRQRGRQPVNRVGGADTRHHVFPLRVDEVLPVQLALACAGVSCEADASAACVAHVAKCHGLDVDGSTLQAHNLVD
mmetsp:Transcript_26972/g.58961  ORF Transcript_26972/g.58961 Transcript_26972/m.58961 type:complete len:401 (+) Transcript_26972:1568-2770(+)